MEEPGFGEVTVVGLVGVVIRVKVVGLTLGALTLLPLETPEEAGLLADGVMEGGEPIT